MNPPNANLGIFLKPESCVFWGGFVCLLLQELEREQGDAKWLDIIEKDLHRQFPFHEMFAARGGHG